MRLECSMARGQMINIWLGNRGIWEGRGWWVIMAGYNGVTDSRACFYKGISLPRRRGQVLSND
jgi:hypothetical protein